MPRVARIVVPGLAHHVTQRGNRRSDVFFDEADRQKYLMFLADYKQRYGLDLLAYCLMTNHIHLVVVPKDETSLGRTMRDTHQAYSSHVNRKLHESGHLWQGRCFSSVLDDSYLWSAVRYVERNPVCAGLVEQAEQYPWSSAAAHCGLRIDPLLSGNLEQSDHVDDWSAWLSSADDEGAKVICQKTTTGRPCGSVEFIERLEGLIRWVIKKQKPGPKPKRK